MEELAALLAIIGLFWGGYLIGHESGERYVMQKVGLAYYDSQTGELVKLSTEGVACRSEVITNENKEERKK